MQMPRDGHMPNKDALFPDYFPRVSLIVLTNCWIKSTTSKLKGRKNYQKDT